MPATRDSLILRITQNGDRDSWEEFATIYRPFLHSVVRRWGFNEHDACDLVQDVFVTLLRALPRFEYRAERGRFRAWLKTIVQRKAVDRLRHRRRSREVAMGGQPAAVCLSTDEWDVVYHRQIAQIALRQVRAMSREATWRCFEEHFIKERPAAEVGREMGMSAGAVYVNVSRTMARIRARCTEFDVDPADACLASLSRGGQEAAVFGERS